MRWVFAALALASAVASAGAIKDAIHFRSKQSEAGSVGYSGGDTFKWLLSQDSFGFNDGGSVHVLLKCNSSRTGRISLLVFTSGQKDEIITGQLDDAPCGSNVNDSPPSRSGERLTAVTIVDASRNEHVANGLEPDGELVFNYTRVIKPGGLRSGFYFFAVRECLLDAVPRGPPAVECQLDLVLLNKNGEHLGSDEIQLKAITKVFAIMWGCALFLWAANRLYLLKFSNRLNDLMACGPVAYTLLLLLDHYQYEYRSTHGHEDKGLADGSALCTMVSSSMLFLATLLACHGWCITRDQVDEGTRMTMGLPLVFFVSSAAMEWLHRYFLAMCIICAIVMVIHILKESGHQLYDLRLRYLEISTVLIRHDTTPEQADVLMTPLLSKRFLVSMTRIVFVGYALCWALLGIMAIYMREARASEYSLNAVLWTAVWWTLLWAFRLRRFAKPPSVTSATDAAEESAAQCHIIEAPHGKQATCVGVAVDKAEFSNFIAALKRTAPR